MVKYHFQRSDWPGVIAMANEALDELASYEDIQWNLLIALWSAGRHVEARETLQVFNLHPVSDTEIHRNREAKCIKERVSGRPLI